MSSSAGGGALPYYNYHNKRITKRLKSNFDLFLSTTESPLVLKHSLSTPSLIRDWICNDCKLQNYTVAWHCLNCESVSFLAPIYKGTLFKKKLNSSIDNNDGNSQMIKHDNTDTICNEFIKNDKNIDDKIGKGENLAIKHKLRSLSMDSGENHLKKCQLCLVNPSEFLNDCKHSPSSPASSSSSSSKIICLPLINQKSRHHRNKLSFDDESLSTTATDNYFQTNLYYSNRKINKSLSSISDQNPGGVGLSSSHYGICDSGHGVNLFGERVITSSLSRPNSFVLSSNLDNYNLRRSLRSSTHNDISNTIYEQRHLMNSNSEYSKLNNINRNCIVNSKNCTIPCDVCGVCNKTECSNAILSSSTSSLSNNTNSRFTVTTITRNDSLSSKLKNLTLPKNGGVFVAVKDWFAQSTPISSATAGPLSISHTPHTQSEKTYYASIRGHATTVQKDNLNNFHTYENQSIKQKTDEPVYAIVNKPSKLKNKQDTKYSYIGMNNEATNSSGNVSNSKSGSDPLYASIGRIGSLNCAVPMAGNNKSSLIPSTNCVISSSDDGNNITSDSSTIYTEVWKGPAKKSLQKT